MWTRWVQEDRQRALGSTERLLPTQRQTDLATPLDPGAPACTNRGAGRARPAARPLRGIVPARTAGLRSRRRRRRSGGPGSWWTNRRGLRPTTGRHPDRRAPLGERWRSAVRASDSACESLRARRVPGTGSPGVSRRTGRGAVPPRGVCSLPDRLTVHTSRSRLSFTGRSTARGLRLAVTRERLSVGEGTLKGARADASGRHGATSPRGGGERDRASQRTPWLAVGCNMPTSTPRRHHGARTVRNRGASPGPTLGKGRQGPQRFGGTGCRGLDPRTESGALDGWRGDARRNPGEGARSGCGHTSHRPGDARCALERGGRMQAAVHRDRCPFGATGRDVATTGAAEVMDDAVRARQPSATHAPGTPRWSGQPSSQSARRPAYAA